MRLATIAPLAVLPLLAAPRAEACPDTVVTEVSTQTRPSTASPCLRNVDFSTKRSAADVAYVVGAGGTSQSGIGNAATAFAGLQLGYAVQFGGDDSQGSYEIEVTGGATVMRSAGDVTATGLVTRGSGRIGPAQVRAAVVDDGSANIAAFPLTMELAHVGELAARPRLSARPELARALYGRERVELSTRVMRVEAAGTKASDLPPGSTPPAKPSAWALDMLPLRGGVDVAMQSGTRFETSVGGAMLGFNEHTTGSALSLLGVEQRWIELPMAPATSLAVLWVLRLDGVDPVTGSQYYMGWGEVIDMPDIDALAQRLDPEEGRLSIGGAGWYANRGWGGFGLQYRREPFVTMTGAVALEDRISGEIYVPRALGLVLRAFAARTTRLVEGDLTHSGTAGVELAASYVRGGMSSKLGFEVGRTFYTALDDTHPMTTGVAAAFGLSIQHAGRRAWTR
jgi:hypothetical protein